jgi:hypothetical protein
MNSNRRRKYKHKTTCHMVINKVQCTNLHLCNSILYKLLICLSENTTNCRKRPIRKVRLAHWWVIGGESECGSIIKFVNIIVKTVFIIFTSNNEHTYTRLFLARHVCTLLFGSKTVYHQLAIIELIYY